MQSANCSHHLGYNQTGYCYLGTKDAAHTWPRCNTMSYMVERGSLSRDQGVALHSKIDRSVEIRLEFHSFLGCRLAPIIGFLSMSPKSSTFSAPPDDGPHQANCLRGRSIFTLSAPEPVRHGFPVGTDGICHFQGSNSKYSREELVRR